MTPGFSDIFICTVKTIKIHYHQVVVTFETIMHFCVYMYVFVYFRIRLFIAVNLIMSVSLTSVRECIVLADLYEITQKQDICNS